MRNIRNLFLCDFLLFACNLFNLISCSLFNDFDKIFLNTLIYLIFVVRIYLVSFLIPIYFPCVIKQPLLAVIFETSEIVFRALFHIPCMSLRLFMTSINIVSHVLVYDTYFFCLRFVYFHNLFHITDGPILCCARAFIL